MSARTRSFMHVLSRKARGQPIDRHVIEKTRSEIESLMSAPAFESSAPLASAVSDNKLECLWAQAISRYGHEIQSVKWWARLRTEPAFFPETGMYDWIEAQILYLTIRLAKPERVVEISPNYGYSTGFILLALNKNNRGSLYSFDLDERYHQWALRNLKRVGIDASRQQFFAGDVRDIADRVLTDKMDLLFMDSDHSAAFAQWYVEHLYPRVTEGGLIHAHDVLKYGVRPHLGDQGEGRVLWEFIQQRPIPASDYAYVSQFVREQPTKPEILQRLGRYPFGEELIGTNNVEQSASLWMVKRF